MQVYLHQQIVQPDSAASVQTLPEKLASESDSKEEYTLYEELILNARRHRMVTPTHVAMAN
jgi:hypothetical protein